MFQWKEAYRIDGDIIDKEHQRLLELADRVIAFVDPVEQAETVKEAIREVYDYIKYHFENEQKLMIEAEFPEYEEHVIDTAR